MYSPFIIIIGATGLLIVLGMALLNPKSAASMFGNMLVFGSAAVVVTGLVLWFLAGDPIRAYLD